MLFKSARANPVFLQLIPRRTWPLSAVGLALFALITMLGVLLIPSAFYDSDLSFVMFYTRIMALSAAVVIILSAATSGFLAAVASGEIMRSEQQALISISLIPTRKLAAGHLMAAFFRMRALWAVCAAMLILMWFTYAYKIRFCECLSRTYYAPCASRLPVIENITAGATFMLALAMFGIGLSMLATCTALAAVFRTHRTSSL